MPILVTCDCGTTLRARDDQAGRSCRCPRCGMSLLVPYPVAKIAAPPPAHQSPGKPRSTTEALLAHRAHLHPDAPHTPPPPAGPDLSALQKRERTWRGDVYWLLILAIIPLVIGIFVPRPDVDAQLEQAVDERPELKARIEEMQFDDIDQSLDLILDALPGHRLPGALLARGSQLHWLFALAAAIVYSAFVAVALPVHQRVPLHLFGAAFFTATFGVTLLLLMQFFGVCFCFVGLWYAAALSPSAPFGPSLLGFVLGVGVCEEIVKCIPVLWRLHKDDIGWRECAMVGMASGAGFGVAEGVHYCMTMYNGLFPAPIYIERFVSTTSFHIMLSAACGILIFRKRRHLQEWKDPFDWVITMMAILIVPIFLHGLYNTLLKKEFDALALLVWLASFAWLVWLISTSRAKELKALQTTVHNQAKTIHTPHGTRYVGE